MQGRTGFRPCIYDGANRDVAYFGVFSQGEEQLVILWMSSLRH